MNTKMTRRQAARLGGQATFRKHGREHMQTIAGETVNLLYGHSKLRAAQAAKGGER